MRALTLAAILCLVTPVFAEEQPATTPTPSGLAAEVRSGEAEADTHPTISSDATWAGNAVIVIALLFLSAAIVGPVARASMAMDEGPVAHSHDASHHAGDHSTDAHGHH
jgi:hypothetical protein